MTFLDTRSPGFLFALGLVFAIPGFCCWMLGWDRLGATVMVLGLGPIMEYGNWEALAQWAGVYYDRAANEIKPAYHANGALARATILPILALPALNEAWRAAIANNLPAMLTMVGAILAYFLASHLIYWRAIRDIAIVRAPLAPVKPANARLPPALRPE